MGEGTLRAIVATDAALTITQWDGGAERLFGASRREAIGQPAPELIAAADGSPHRRERLLATGEWQGITQLRAPAGLVVVESIVARVNGNYLAVHRQLKPTKLRDSVSQVARISHFPESQHPGLLDLVETLSGPKTIDSPAGTRIKMMREQAGLSKRQLAKLANVGRYQLSTWEAGTHIPSVPSLLKLIPHIGGNVLYYLGIDENDA